MDYDKVSELIENARMAGLELWLEGREIRFRARKGSAALDVLPSIRMYKQELLEALAGPNFVRREAERRTPILNFYSSLWEKTLGDELGAWFSNSTNWIIRMDGPLDLEALRRAIDTVVSRHGILCCWVAPGGQHYQFESGRHNPLHFRDLTHIGADAHALRKCVSEYIWTPFPAVGEPLFRSFAMRISADRHVVGFVVHHFIADNVTVATIADEITQAYAQISGGGAPTFASTPLQYADYVRAYNDWLEGGGFRIRLAYWRNHLRGANASRLPPSYQVSGNGPSTIRSLRFDIDPAMTKRLRRLAEEQGTTLYVLLLAAKVHAMSKIDHAAEHLVLAMHDGRDDARLAKMAGSCQNQLLLRIAHDPGDPFLSTIRRVHRIWFAALENQIPYHFILALLEELGIEKRFSELNAADGGETDVTGARFTVPGARFAIDPAPPRPSTPKDLGTTSTMILAGIGISIEVLYVDTLYSASDIQRFLDLIGDTLLTSVAADDAHPAGMPASSARPLKHAENAM